MKCPNQIRLLALLAMLCITCGTKAANSLDIGYDATFMGNMSTGEFAPYYISSLKYGKVTQKNSLIADISVARGMEMDKRASWGFGAEVLAMTTSSNQYDKWSQEHQQWYTRQCRPDAFRLQQLYAEVKYRSLFATLGQKNQQSMIVDTELSSGDLIQSGNARPIPEIRGGFHDYVNIPYTQDFVQVSMQLSYGVMTDERYLEDRYNYYNYHLGSNTLYNYKHCLFRTNPDKPFSVIAGMSCGAFFGGKTKFYDRGKVIRVQKFHSDLKAMLNIMLPVFNHRDDYYEGSTLGSWDFHARYRLRGGQDICAYFEWPFEDGSGIAKRNKLDGLWGLEFKTNNNGPLTKVVVEYVDFRDQGGPIHFAVDDFNNPTIDSHATGRDNYCNNGYYNSYANYGMAIGTPFMPSPIYNLDGYPAFACNRINGVHIGATGNLTQAIRYRLLMGHQRGLGTYDLPFDRVKRNTSLLVEANYKVNNSTSLNLQLAMDHGQLRGNNYGILMSLRYSGCLKKHRNK